MTRGRKIAGAAVAAGAVAATGVVLAAGGGAAEEGDDAPATRSTATTKIVQQDLVERETVDGTLGYSDARPVIDRHGGTVTWTPAIGSVVRTNHRLYEVDGDPVFLLDGAYPAYRTLSPGLEGDDVLALERNLRMLDLDPDRDMRVDGTWDAGTTAAVQRWQERKGLAETGSIELGRIVFQPGARRISSVNVRAGESVGGGEAAGSAGSGGAGGGAAQGGTTVLSTTSTKRIVAIALEATKQNLASPGAKVEVEFPSGADVGGRIVRVGRVAQKEASQGDDDAPATVKVIVRLDRSSGTGLDQAPVDVRLTKSRAKNVLTVPVTALIARQGGGFAVEVRDGAARRVVQVQTGLYTDSYVEIRGTGLRPGMAVTDARV